MFSMKIMIQPIRAVFATIGWKSSILNFNLVSSINWDYFIGSVIGLAFVCKIIWNIQQIRSWVAKKLCNWSIKNWYHRTSRDPIGCLKYIQHIHIGHLHYFIGLAQFRSGPMLEPVLDPVDDLWCFKICCGAF